MRKLDWPAVLAVATGTIIVAVSYPFVGWAGAIPLGAVAFMGIALVGSGGGVGRVAGWVLVDAGLFALGTFLTGIVGSIVYGGAAVLFFAVVLHPGFRRLVVGPRVE